MKDLHAICKEILLITDAELNEAEGEARRQINYIHPLKMATATRTQEAGRHNLRVISALRALKKEIETP